MVSNRLRVVVLYRTLSEAVTQTNPNLGKLISPDLLFITLPALLPLAKMLPNRNQCEIAELYPV